ncbi:MAG: peptidoglycan-binding protein [Acidobacteria bacterium]|nr:peptidoglycan-binding protein [Acidobacteriota bacterium]
MRKRMFDFVLAFVSAGALCCAASPVLAQDATADADAGLQPVSVVVNAKVVKAVQSALIGTGHYRARPNGVLDGETRESLLAFQTANNLEVTGRINTETLDALGVDPKNPVAASERRNGFIPKVGYSVKDGAVKSKDTVVGGAKYVGRKTRQGYDTVVQGTKTGLTKTKDVATGGFRKSKDVTLSAGQSTKEKMGAAGNKSGNAMTRATTAVVGRSDTDINLDIRDLLDDDAETNKFSSTVKSGAVTIKLPTGYDGDASLVVSRLRKVPGVKTVMVVQP